MDRALAFYRLTHGPEGPARLLEALRSAAAAFAEPGSRSARVFVEADDSRGLLLMEEWDAREDLTRHIRSPAFRRVLAVLELSQTPPEVTYVEGGRLRGMEWIYEIRGGGDEGVVLSKEEWR